MKKLFTLTLLIAVAFCQLSTAHAQKANVTDSLAVVALYNSANGAGWLYNTNWITTSALSTWAGIFLDAGGRVITINLTNNQLSGSIPPQLGNLTSLQNLYLGSDIIFSNNQLSGSIPAELGNLTSLQNLDLKYNQLSGSIPTGLGNLTNLQNLFLENNQLSGSIPTGLGNLTNLQNLDLGANQLSGSIPMQLGNLTNLQYLDLQYNQLSGNIPATLGNLANIKGLALRYNRLSGSIPAELGNLINLQSLFLNNNQLSGSIPAELGNFTKLYQFSLSFWLNDNKFTFSGMDIIARKYPSYAVYSPQDTILPIQKTGNIIWVAAGGAVANNTYSWYSGATLKATIVGDSTYSPPYPGSYSVVVTNSLVPYLKLYSDTFTTGSYSSLIMPAKPNTEYANYETTDDSGWTHYYYDNHTPGDFSDDTLLLSIQKNGEDIGTIGDGVFAVKLVATAAAGTNSSVKITNPLIDNPSGYWVMNRYWQVTATREPTSAVGVRFYYNNQDVNDVNGSYPGHNLTNSKLIFYKEEGGNPDPTTNLVGATRIFSIMPGTYAGDTSWTYHALSDTTQYAEYEVQSFSGGGGGGTGNNGALPVTFLTFTAQYSHEGSLLQWQTANEVNSNYFNVQRSTDGRLFTTVGKVNAAGNSVQTQRYRYTDGVLPDTLSPTLYNLYYRIVEVDKNGMSNYSKIIKLDGYGSAASSIIIYPNPVQDKLMLMLKGITGKATVVVSDAKGSILLKRQFSATVGEAINLNLAQYAAGVYFVRVLYNNGQAVTQKFIKK